MKFKLVNLIKAKIMKHAACVGVHLFAVLMLVVLAYLASIGGIVSVATMVFFFAVMIAIPADNTENG